MGVRREGGVEGVTKSRCPTSGPRGASLRLPGGAPRDNLGLGAPEWADRRGPGFGKRWLLSPVRPTSPAQAVPGEEGPGGGRARPGAHCAEVGGGARARRAWAKPGHLVTRPGSSFSSGNLSLPRTPNLGRARGSQNVGCVCCRARQGRRPFQGTGEFAPQRWARSGPTARSRGGQGVDANYGD